MAVNYSNVTVGNTATLVLASNPGRRMFSVYNNGAVTMYLGPDANVATTTGTPILPQASYTQNGSRMYMGAWYGITASSTVDVRYMDYGE
jgi:hypothetical protein